MPNGIPPAQPPGPGAPPPGAPPAGGPGPAPEQVGAAAEEQAAAQQGAIGAGAPQPKKPYSVKRIVAIDKQFIQTLEKLAGDAEIPEQAEWQPPEGMGPKWEQPLPPEVFSRLALFAQVMTEVGEDQAKKYGFDPSELVDDSALAKVEAKLKMAAKDKKLAAAIQEPQAGGPAGGPPPEGGPPPPPGPEGISEDDETLMGAA